MKNNNNGKRKKGFVPRVVCQLRTPQIARRNSAMTRNA
jgi:hypothetical protein